MKKLAIIISHPVQYYSPLFKLLALECDLMVYYTAGKEVYNNNFDEGFKQKIKWDIPLLEGYNYTFAINAAKDPGLHHFYGVQNKKLIKDIKLFNPDAILVYGWSYYSHLQIMRHFKGKIPIWFRGDSTLLDQNASLKSFLRKIFLHWVYGYVDKAFYVGTANKAYYEAYGLKDNELLFAPHAIDNSRFSEDRLTESRQLRKNLGLAQEDILILFAGKFEEKKNPTLLLEAFQILNSPNTHLLFVGNGELEANLKSMSQSYESNANRIHFMNFQNQNQMPVIYQSCDIFCLPSKGPGETWGLAVNEAMAAGKAILVSNKVGCATDLINSGENGFIFESQNIKEFVNKLKALLDLDLLKLGQKSKDIIRNWNFENQMICLLENLNKYL